MPKHLNFTMVIPSLLLHQEMVNGYWFNPMAEGRVSISNSIVWIVVHPMAVADYWVQQPGTANNNGDWRCLINVGREGTVDTGKYFEIRAFVYPNRTLRNGLVLESWPDARIKSDIITVKRR